MPKFKFKNTGVRIMETEAGDIMLCDSGLKADTIIVREMIDRAKNDDKIATHIGKQIVNFVLSQRQIRITIARKKLDLIERFDKRFADNLRPYLEKDNVRKVEKDIHFFVNDNPEVDEEIIKNIS